MKNFVRLNFRAHLLILLLCLTNLIVFAQDNKPFSPNESPLGAPTSPVMDYAGVLDANTKAALEKKIIAFRDSTNPRIELAVAIVETTGDRDIFSYSLAVARGWKIGSDVQDNPGALLFIAVKDRKYFTQISKDLEDELPDGLAGQLQRENLVPAFKQGNYGKGISDTIDAYIETIQSKQTGVPPIGKTKKPAQQKGSVSICSIFICLIVIFFIVLPALGRFGSSGKNRNDRNRWGGGGFGGGGGVSSALPWIIGSIISNSGGGSSGSSSDWGSSSGGGDSWGGFGGGGDFGGGGAGGDW